MPSESTRLSECVPALPGPGEKGRGLTVGGAGRASATGGESISKEEAGSVVAVSRGLGLRRIWTEEGVLSKVAFLVVCLLYKFTLFLLQVVAVLFLATTVRLCTPLLLMNRRALRRCVQATISPEEQQRIVVDTLTDFIGRRVAVFEPSMASTSTSS